MGFAKKRPTLNKKTDLAIWVCGSSFIFSTKTFCGSLSEFNGLKVSALTLPVYYACRVELTRIPKRVKMLDPNPLITCRVRVV